MKYSINQIVNAKFSTERVITSKEYRNETIITKGVVLFDQDEQCYYVRSIDKLPIANYKTNGLFGTRSSHKAKSWYIQGEGRLIAKISDIVDENECE